MLAPSAPQKRLMLCQPHLIAKPGCNRGTAVSLFGLVSSWFAWRY